MTTVNPDDSSLKNMVRNLERLTTDEEKNIPVEINFNGKIVKVKTDKDGLFNQKIRDFGILKPGYNKVTVVVSDETKKYFSNPVDGNVVVHSKNDSTLAVVTDIDDTIQRSDVTSKLTMIKNMLFKDYMTQERIPGVTELYQAIDNRNDGIINGDVFYVTGSPLSLSDRIENFIEYNKFPKGSIDMKNIGIGSGHDSLTDQVAYKLSKIRPIFYTYPNKKFILFGDNGEKDPEIYTQISQEFPGRVISIFINNITKDTNKTAARYKSVVLTNNAGESAAELLKKGLITNEDLANVKKAVL